MKLVSLQVGKPGEHLFNGRPVMTGIYKEAVLHPVYLGAEQLDGDGQADLVNHGGPDKAVCVYCAEHYPYWRQRLDRELEYGAFGENFTVAGMPETDVRIGDIYEIGEAVVQLSQPRQPCFKLGGKHELNELPLYVQETGYTGYYFRVLKPGMVAAGQPLRLVERHSLQVTVAYANGIKYHDKQNAEGVRRILQVAELAQSWRESFSERLRKLESLA
ncbi:MOSC domain-containing protein [Paenibacillus hamazuiensis]|uniref:MOSC domain-containing protein n=1 Tax=Paenibacillus hamazuiensis TaxID=2936508 RepID=UPI00200DC6B9|nr:MOSC domain-containing protein [Paenibacillus hamazuiensis]